jgi:hypothetical protein
MTCGLRLTLAFLVALTACREAAAPPARDISAEAGLTAQRNRPGPQPDTATEAVHVLQQSPSAARLVTYRTSFWLHKGRESTIRVNYQPTGSQLVGRPFLRFGVPKQGLEAGGGGAPLRPGDSVLITLTIDTLAFAVHFEPSGVRFSSQFPADLAFWYANANPDLNGDGVVDGTDEAWQSRIAIWYRGRRWAELPSLNDTKQQYVLTELGHFSEYAVSW